MTPDELKKKIPFKELSRCIGGPRDGTDIYLMASQPIIKFQCKTGGKHIYIFDPVTRVFNYKGIEK